MLSRLLMASWVCSAKRDHMVKLLGSRLHSIYLGALIRADPRPGITWLHRESED